MLRAITDRMSLAIHFDGKAALKAGEVDHVSVTRKLPPKSNTGRSFAKLLP